MGHGVCEGPMNGGASAWEGWWDRSDEAGGPRHADWKTVPRGHRFWSRRAGAAKSNRPAFRCELCHGLLCDGGGGRGGLFASVSPSMVGDCHIYLPRSLWELKEQLKGSARHSLWLQMWLQTSYFHMALEGVVGQGPSPGCVFNSFSFPRGCSRGPSLGTFLGQREISVFLPPHSALCPLPTSVLLLPYAPLGWAAPPTPPFSSPPFPCAAGRGGPSHCTIFGP